MKFKKILVTGGEGYLGSSISSGLRKNYIVSIGTRRKKNDTELRVFETDFNIEESIFQACKDQDVVVHAAGFNAYQAEVDPTAAKNFSEFGTKNLLKSCTRAQVKLLIYISTVHTYSNKLVGIINEKTTPNNNHPYARNKLITEKTIEEYSNRVGLKAVILRLSNAIGLSKNIKANCWQLLVNDICSQAVKDRKIVLKSNGMEYRNFITLTDLNRIIKKIIKSNIKEEITILNAGGNITMTVKEMTELVAYRCEVMLGYSPQIFFLTAGPKNNSLESFVYDISELKKFKIKLKDNLSSEIDIILKKLYESR